MIDFLLENLDLILNAPNGIKRLRETILQLAVQGKLVPQDPNDQPASELLKNIQIEKERLIKEKKIKKQKPLPPISEDEVSFDIPEGWEWVRLGFIGDIYNGNSLNKSKKEIYSKVDVGLPYIATKDIGYGSVDVNYENGIKIPYKAEKMKVAYSNSTLVCSEGGSAGRKIALLNKDVNFGNKLLTHKPFSCVLPKLTFYTYQSPYFYSLFKSKMTGIIGGISISNFKELLVPLPPLAEQKRIVEKVDSLMAFCDKLEELKKERDKKRTALNKSSLALLMESKTENEFEVNWQKIVDNFELLFSTPESIKELKQAILQLAVQGKLVPQDPNDQPASELLKEIKAEKEKLIKDKKIKKQKPLPPISEDEIPFEIPQGWEWCRLNELTILITKGSSPKWQGIDYTDSDNGVLFITSENVGSFNLKLKNKKYVERRFNEIQQRSILMRNDLLMNIVGASIGRVAVYDITDIANINQAVCIIRLMGKNLSNSFILSFLNSRTCISYMFDKQVDNARANLSMTNISKFLIPLPPLLEQKRIVEKVDSLMDLCDKLEEKLSASITKSEKIVNALVNGLG